jgi:hypothetical protein
VDVYVGEQRNAFPLAVPAGENRVVWVDLFVVSTTACSVFSHWAAFGSRKLAQSGFMGTFFP